MQKHLAEVDGFDHVDVLNAASRIAFAKFDNNNIKTKTTGPNMHLSSAYLPLQHQGKRNETVSASLDSVFPSQ